MPNPWSYAVLPRQLLLPFLLPLPHALCQVSWLTFAYHNKAIAHPLCGPTSLPSEELFPAQVQLQGPIFQTHPLLNSVLWTHPWRGPAFIHIFVYPYVSYPLIYGEYSVFSTLSDYLSLKTETYPTTVVSVCIWGHPTLISLLYWLSCDEVKHAVQVYNIYILMRSALLKINKWAPNFREHWLPIIS